MTIPAANAIILEIKYDGFIPEIIRQVIQIGDRHETEFSKYVVSRLYNKRRKIMLEELLNLPTSTKQQLFQYRISWWH